MENPRPYCSYHKYRGKYWGVYHILVLFIYTCKTIRIYFFLSNITVIACCFVSSNETWIIELSCIPLLAAKIARSSYDETGLGAYQFHSGCFFDGIPMLLSWYEDVRRWARRKTDWSVGGKENRIKHCTHRVFDSWWRCLWLSRSTMTSYISRL